ncbi:MAG TPA: hypothetical protein VLT86_16095 [Vicinamibacterales bacterium]|nr:hypothetical protein [Vicinamibacterales bacterium]
MRQSSGRFVTIISLVAAFMAPTACGSNTISNVPTTPVNPTTDTFAGTLTVNGAVTHTFVVLTAGTITATLTTVGPDSTTPIGISIGNWSGTTCSVGQGLFQDHAVQGAILTATVSLPGTLCLRVYDPGTLTDSATYSVDVVHP